MRQVMMLVLGALALFARPAQAATAQQEDVQVALSSALVKLGEPVGVLIRVEGDIRVRFGPLPSVDGLELSDVVQTGRQQSVSYDPRGRPVVERTNTYEVRIRPTGVGKYTIPPLAIEVDGKMRSAPDEPMVLEIVADIEASQLLLFERDPLPATVYEGEPYTVELRFGWDVTRKLADAELQLPWWGRQDGVIELNSGASQRGAFEIPIRPGRRAASIEELNEVDRDGRRFKIFRLRRRYVATRSGTVEFGRSLFKFGELVGRSGGVFTRGRTRSYYAPIEPFELEVLPVPETGRPLEWTGAVGRVEASRDAARRDIDLGDVIELQVRWTGEGNLEFFDPPDLSRLDAFRRFRVLGVEDQKGPGERLVTYDLVPLDASIDEIPPVPLPVFDTELGRYVTVETEPLRIRVKSVAGAGDDPFGGPEEREEEAPIVLRDIVARPVLDSGGGTLSRGPGAGAGPFVLVLGAMGWVLLRRSVRRRGDPASARARRRRQALRKLSSDVRGVSSAADLAHALEVFLARRSGEGHEAWIGRGSLAAAADSSVPEAVEADYVRLRGDLDRAIFGGEAAVHVDAERVLTFARAAVREGV